MAAAMTSHRHLHHDHSAALRLGFMVVPPKPGHRLADLAACLAPRAAVQRVGAPFPREGRYLRPFRHMKRVCVWRRERLLRWLGEITAGSTRVKATAGLVMVVLMPKVTWDVDIAFRAWPFGLAPVALARWHMQSPH
jgi:GntR family transcriptional regulator/MocR family aminotransferase